MIIKIIQTKIIEFIENIFHIFFPFLSNYQKGIFLIIIHFILISTGIILFFLTNNILIKYTILISSIIIFASQILFRGCIITRVERRLSNTDITVVDPILYLANIDRTKETRYSLTLGLSIGLMVSMILTIIKN
jgi:hypothetical protein